MDDKVVSSEDIGQVENQLVVYVYFSLLSKFLNRLNIFRPVSSRNIAVLGFVDRIVPEIVLGVAIPGIWKVVR